MADRLLSTNCSPVGGPLTQCTFFSSIAMPIMPSMPLPCLRWHATILTSFLSVYSAPFDLYSLCILAESSRILVPAFFLL